MRRPQLLPMIVGNALNAARENGYFQPGEQLHGATAEEIADDMLAYEDDVGDYAADELLPHIRAWLARNPQ